MQTSIQAVKKRINQSMYTQKVNNNAQTLDEIIEALKANPNFSTWSDDEIYDYARGIIKKRNETILQNGMTLPLDKQNRPGDKEWLQYTYEEILQMEDNGVLIPEDVLEWAHSMSDANTVEYELDTGDSTDINDSEGLAADIGDAGDSGKKNKTRVFNKQVTKQEQLITEAEKEFERYSGEIEITANKAESIQNNALKEVQNLMNEWKILDKKSKSGETMTEAEKARYRELGVLMDSEVKNSTLQIKDFTTDFDRISQLMQTASKDAKIAQDYATDTTFTGDLITEYESKHDSRTVMGNNHIFDGATGTVDLLKSNTIGKNLAIMAIQSGNTLKTSTFTQDKSIKKVNNQIKSIVANVNGNNDNIETVANNNNIDTNTNPPLNENNKVEPPPIEDNPEILNKTNKQQDDKNIFAENEDFNNINSILRRQRKQSPKQPPQEIIVE